MTTSGTSSSSGSAVASCGRGTGNPSRTTSATNPSSGANSSCVILIVRKIIGQILIPDGTILVVRKQASSLSEEIWNFWNSLLSPFFRQI
jgi:hypothetical protein